MNYFSKGHTVLIYCWLDCQRFFFVCFVRLVRSTDHFCHFLTFTFIIYTLSLWVTLFRHISKVNLCNQKGVGWSKSFTLSEVYTSILPYKIMLALQIQKEQSTDIWNKSVNWNLSSHQNKEIQKKSKSNGTKSVHCNMKIKFSWAVSHLTEYCSILASLCASSGTRPTFWPIRTDLS